MFDNDKIKKEKLSRRYINDFILLAAVFIIAFLFLIIIRKPISDNAYINISYSVDSDKNTNNATNKLIDLNDSYGYYVISIEDGLEISNSFNTLDSAIEYSKSLAECNIIFTDGKSVDVCYATCPDKLCENFKKITHNGESIICLPHKLVIVIESNISDDGGIDAVTY